MSTKRQDYISWDEYFMGVAMLSGMRSKDPTHRLEPVLSVTNTKFFPWDIMDFQPDVPMMISHGYAKAMTTNTLLYPQ